MTTVLESPEDYWSIDPTKVGRKLNQSSEFKPPRMPMLDSSDSDTEGVGEKTMDLVAFSTEKVVEATQPTQLID